MQYIKDVFQTLRRYQGGCFEWSGKHAQWECFGPTANPQLEIVVAEEDAQNTALTLKVVKLFFCTAVI